MKNKIKTFADLNRLLDIGRVPSPEVQVKYKEFKSKNIPTKKCETDIHLVYSSNQKLEKEHVTFKNSFRSA